MRKLHFGIDIDEPIYPWMQQAHLLCIREGLAERGSPCPSRWDPFMEYPGPPDLQQWFDVLAVGAIDGSLYEAEPDHNAIKQLKRIRKDGHFIHLVTTRGVFVHGDLIRSYTHKMLAKYDIPHDSISFASDKSWFKFDYWLDDHPKNVEALHAADQTAFLLRVPHNEWYTPSYPYQDCVVGSVKEFVDVVYMHEKRGGWRP